MDLNESEDDPRRAEIQALARDYAEDAIQALVDVFRNPVELGSARAAASRTLLQVADMMPERRTKQRTDVHIYDERKAHFDALQRMAARNTPLIEDKSHVEDAEFSEVRKR